MNDTIKKGAYYRDGFGRIHGPALPSGDIDFPWQVGAYFYTEAGSYFSDRASPLDIDLQSAGHVTCPAHHR